MLTVIRSLAEAAEDGAARDVARGDETVMATRELLPVLRDAGVVDAGGAGLMEIVRGMAAVLAGEPLPQPPEQAEHRPRGRPPGALALPVLHRSSSRATELDREALERRARPARRLAARRRRPLGPEGARAHRRPRPALVARHRARRDRGRRDREHAPAGRGARGAAPAPRAGRRAATASSRSSPAPGNRRLFESLGAIVVDGGADDEPRHVRALAAIESAAGVAVVVLPNNGNVIMSAEQAAAHAAKAVRVVPTGRSRPDSPRSSRSTPGRAAEENAAGDAGGARARRTGAVDDRARATFELDGVAVREGECLGLAEGEPVARGDEFDEVARRCSRGSSTSRARS